MSDNANWDSDAHLRGVIDEYMSAFDPAPEETAGLRERILTIVRGDLHRGPSTQLTTERGNPFRITTASVRAMIREAVDSVDGIRARSVEVTPTGDPEGSATGVALTVAMRAGVVFTTATEVIRRRVAETLIAELGIPASTIDITVEDVFVSEEAEDV